MMSTCLFKGRPAHVLSAQSPPISFPRQDFPYCFRQATTMVDSYEHGVWRFAFGRRFYDLLLTWVGYIPVGASLLSSVKMGIVTESTWYSIWHIHKALTRCPTILELALAIIIVIDFYKHLSLLHCPCYQCLELCFPECSKLSWSVQGLLSLPSACLL